MSQRLSEEITNQELRQEIVDFMETANSPVWSPADLTYRFFREDTNSNLYRRVHRQMGILRDAGVCGYDLWASTNQSCYWLHDRVKYKNWLQPDKADWFVIERSNWRNHLEKLYSPRPEFPNTPFGRDYVEMEIPF